MVNIQKTKKTLVKKMSQMLGTYVLNIGDECTERLGQMSTMFGTFFRHRFSSIYLMVHILFTLL